VLELCEDPAEFAFAKLELFDRACFREEDADEAEFFLPFPPLLLDEVDGGGGLEYW